MDTKKEEPKVEIKLTKAELTVLSQVLFNSQWNGQQWQQVVTPLINKLAKMIDLVK